MVLEFVNVNRRNILKPRPPRRVFKKEEKHIVGRNIRAQRVRCINTDGSHEVLDLFKALELAKNQELDLVQISPEKEEVPTCKIVDYSKFKYEFSKKEKAAKKKQRENAIKIKEIKFRPSTGDHDLQIKAKQAQSFIDDGNKLKVTIVFKGREIAYRNVAQTTLNKFFEYLNGVDFESQPSVSGKFMSAMIVKKPE